MTVYYVATEEKPKNTENVKFFTDHASAMVALKDLRGCSIYQFNVNSKCDTNSFGLDTQMLFKKDDKIGELKFVASGRWVEIHELLNIPFYYDFEDRSKNFVSMSLKYFSDHFQIMCRKSSSPKSVSVKSVSVDSGSVESTSNTNKNVVSKNDTHNNESFIDDAVLSKLFGDI